MLSTRLSVVALVALLAGCAPMPKPQPIPTPPPQPVPTHSENLAVRSVSGVSMNNATAKLIPDDGSGTFEAVLDPEAETQPDHAGRYQFFVQTPGGGGWLFVWADGHFERALRVFLHVNSGELLAGCLASEDASSRCESEDAVTLTLMVKRPPVEMRAPLAPLPGGGNGYNRDIAAVWPDGPPAREGCDFVRADLWGVEIPGLPWVPGASTRHPERLLTWFIDRYDDTWFERAMFEHAKRGYTHWYLSYDDSTGRIDNGPNSPPGNGKSLAEFVETARRIRKDYGFCVEVFLLSKYWSPGRGTPAQVYINKVAPVMDALIAADAVDGFVSCWECDLMIDDGPPIIEYFRFVRDKAHAAGKKASVHFSTEKTSWFKDGDPRGRFGFWDDIRGTDRLLYQADSNWSAEDLQGRIADTLNQIRRQPWFSIVAFELVASEQWDHDHPNENDANLTCIVAMLTKVPGARVAGYGNGCRLQSGAPF